MLGAIDLLILEKTTREDTGGTPLHAHPFWQLEIALEGPIEFVWQGRTDQLHPGDLLLLAPDEMHLFRYGAEPSTWITLKFACDPKSTSLSEGTLIRYSSFNERFIAALQTMVTGGILKPYEKIFAEGFIQSLFRYLEEAVEGNGHPDHALVRTVKDLVGELGGKAVSIQDLAERMSYTRSHLSKQYQALTGENLKGYIDRVRTEKAKEQLLYSESTIAEIAETMGFRDLFAFSRFFKRGTGESPREFRGKITSGRKYVPQR